MELTTLAIRQVAAGALLRELSLRAGAAVAVRVVAAAPEGGLGTISLAGALVEARLPPGLEPGQRLQLRVLGPDQGTVVLQVLAGGGQQSERGEVARAAGALAVSGEPTLVQIAHGLQQPDLALPLPNGGALRLDLPVDVPVQGDPDEDAGEQGEAAFVLHSTQVGAIEVRLRLGAGRLGVTVVVDRAALEAARAAAPELVRALAGTTGAQPTVEVAGRAAGERPPVPQVEETLDAYA